MISLMQKSFLVVALQLAAAGCGSDGGQVQDSPGTAAGTSIAFRDATGDSAISFKHVPTRTDAKLMPEIMGSGVVVADFNRDGAPDVLLVNSGSMSSAERTPDQYTRFYLNDGKGKFTDKTDEWKLPSRHYGMGAAAGDYDNDGFTDVLLTNFEGKNTLLRNTGSAFEDVTANSGIASDGKWSVSAGFLDYDNDGDLDIFVVRYIEFSTENAPRSFRNRILVYPTPLLYAPVTDQLWKNDGNGRFTNVSEAANFRVPEKGLAVAIGDVDKDGWTDIYVANDSTPNQFWQNRKGTFIDIAQVAGVAYDEMGREEGSMGADFSDIDLNGLEDIMVTNFQTEVTSLYMQVSKGLFQESSDLRGVGETSRNRLSWGIDAFDANNDGLEDLLFVNGHIEDNINLNSDTVTFPQQNSLFLNIGDGKFRDVSDSSGDALKDIQVSRGLATGDLNGDGLIDFVVNNNGGTAQVAFNTSPQPGNFVMLWLEGTKANRSAIGARLVAKIGERTIERQVMGAQSYLSMSDLRAHFGLGQAEKIDELTIHWPGSEKQVINDVRAGAFYYIREGNSPVVFVPGEKRIEP